VSWGEQLSRKAGWEVLVMAEIKNLHTNMTLSTFETSDFRGDQHYILRINARSSVNAVPDETIPEFHLDGTTHLSLALFALAATILLSAYESHQLV